MIQLSLSNIAALKNSTIVSFSMTIGFMFLSVLFNWNWPHRIELHIDIKSSVNAITTVYYDIGNGLNEKNAITSRITRGECIKTLKFPLPIKMIRRIRLDPLNKAGKVYIIRISLFDDLNHFVQRIPLRALHQLNQIRSLRIENNILAVVTDPNATDPMLGLELKYPLSLETVYPIKRRIIDNFMDNFNYMRKEFMVVFGLTWLSIFLACIDLKPESAD